MTDQPFQVDMEGLSEALEKMDPAVYSEPLRDMFKKAAIVLQSASRSNAMQRWHDTGQTANEIVYEVDDSDPPKFAKVGLLHASPGSPLWFKARAGEYGTGRMGDPIVSHAGGHWPPGDELSVWASRHGFASGGQVARIIGMRGGIEPRRYLRDAFTESVTQIRGLIGELAAAIGARWSGQ